MENRPTAPIVTATINVGINIISAKIAKKSKNGIPNHPITNSHK